MGVEDTMLGGRVAGWGTPGKRVRREGLSVVSVVLSTVEVEESLVSGEVRFVEMEESSVE